MSASGLSRASSGKRASFMDPTASSAVKEREKATPSRQPSSRSNVSAVPTTGGGSSPGAGNAKTIEAFLQDARNAVGMGSPGAGSPGYSPRTGSRARSPPSPGSRGAARSRSVSPGRAERTPNRAASSTTLRWNAPLPGDTLAASARVPASPGTPAVFSSGTLGADAFAGGFAPRAAHAPFDVLLDPALRLGVKNLGGNPAVATSLLPTAITRDGFGGLSGGVSGATFGDVFSRERAASVTRFREAALVRDQLRTEGGFAGNGLYGNADTAAKADIARLDAAVAELASEVRAFRAGASRRGARSENAEKTLRDDDDDDDDDDDGDDEGDENVPPGRDRSPPRSRLAVASPAAASEDRLRASPSPAGSSRSLRLETDSRDARGAGPAASVRAAGAAIRAATRAAREGKRREAAAALSPSTEAKARGVGNSEERGTGATDRATDRAPAQSDAGRYLRTTRRDMEAARYARGLKAHSGSPPKQFWGEGRDAVLGGGAAALDTLDARADGARSDAGAHSDDGAFSETDRRRGSTRDAERRAPTKKVALDSGVADDAAAAFAAALSAIDARREAQPDPAATIARLRERNRALRRELGVAQRLMTGYHAQLMTGGLPAPASSAAGRDAPPPSYGRRRPSRRPFEAPAGRPPIPDSRGPTWVGPSGPRRGGPPASLRSTRRAESKRTAAERSAARAERALAETAAEADARDELFDESDVSEDVWFSGARGDDDAAVGAARVAEEVAALKETVVGLVRRMDADAENASRRRASAAARSAAGSTAGSGSGSPGSPISGSGSRSERPSVVASRASPRADAPGETFAERLAGGPAATRGDAEDEKRALPASEVSFAFEDDGENAKRTRGGAFRDGAVPGSARVGGDGAATTAPAMSLETDTAFLRTPARSPGGGEVESGRADAP